LVEEILPNVFRIEVPLPRNPLKALNSYLFKGPERNLIIDTGMNREECRSAMYAGLAELRVDLSHTDFFITHLHADHSGLISTLATPTSSVYASEADSRVINGSARWGDQAGYAKRSGFPEELLEAAIGNHPGYRYKSGNVTRFTFMSEGDTLVIGDYRFTCLETPGHTGGHLCLYEPVKKILVSGDHVLDDITPNIGLWSDELNTLKDYLNSLDKVYGLEAELVLPGHRRIFTDLQRRVQELKHHHQARANEVLTILAKGPDTAYRIASQMTWDIRAKSWEEFPVSQKWFATGEAISHLKYLEEKGAVRREDANDRIVYSLSG